MKNQSFKRHFGHIIVLASLTLFAAVFNVSGSVFANSQTRVGSTVRIERTTAEPTGAASVFGIDDGGVVYASQTTLDLAAATGAHWERISLYWSALEPTQGAYDFSSADKSLVPLLAKGFALIVYLDENPSWAANTDCGPVDTKNSALVTSFANMLGALAARYPDVKIWAAYNEVDFDEQVSKNTGGCFGSRTAGGVNNNGIRDYQEYAIMLAAAWDAVHTANPNALFASGALAYDNFNTATAPSGYPGGGNGGLFNYEFAPSLFTYMSQHPLSQNRKYMDMLLFNFYNIYGPFWQTKAKGYGIQAKSAVLRYLMNVNGIPVVPLFITETGEYSTNDWIGLNGQARCLTMTMVRGAATKLTGVIWWTFKDFPNNAPPPQNTWKYGIVDQNLQPKLSYTAFQTIANQLNGAPYKKTLSNKTGFNGIEAYKFAKKGLTKYVVWGYSMPNPPEPWKPECSWARYTRLAKFTANKIRVVTYLGQTKTIRDNSKKDKDPAVGSIGINAGADPLIVQINP